MLTQTRPRAAAVRLGLAAVVALSTLTAVAGEAAVPGSAVPTLHGGAVVVRGPAGGELTVRLPADAALDANRQFRTPPQASRGDFAGFVVITPAGDHFASVTSGVASRGCAFAVRCVVTDWPDVEGSDPVSRRDGSTAFALPAGTYRLGLLGTPGATVTATIELGTGRVTDVLRTHGTGNMRAQSLASTDPATSDEQPVTDGSTTFDRRTGLTIVGDAIRWDLEVPHEVDYSTCIGSTETPSTPSMSVAGNTLCRGNGGGTGGAVQVYTCGAVPVLCLPVSTDSEPTVLSVSESQIVPPGSPDFAVATQSQALHSHVQVTVFALTL